MAFHWRNGDREDFCFFNSVTAYEVNEAFNSTHMHLLLPPLVTLLRVH